MNWRKINNIILKSYMTFIQAVLSGGSEEEREQALETLRMLPDDKGLI